MPVGLHQVQEAALTGLEATAGVIVCWAEGNVPLADAVLAKVEATLARLTAAVAKHREYAAVKAAGNHAYRGPGWDKVEAGEAATPPAGEAAAPPESPAEGT